MARPHPPSLAAQDDTALLNPATRDRLLDQMRTRGYRDLRTNVIYGRVKEQGYGAYDDLVNAARARGLHVQMTLMGTPMYAPQWDQTLSYSHNDPRQWQQFANQVATHFKGRVGRYSIGNEMQFNTFFQPKPGAINDPANPVDARNAGRAYRGVYRGGYAGVKAADPTAQVLLGEATSVPNAREWLRGVLGGKKAIRTSGFAYHPYDQPNQSLKTSNTWDIDNLADLQATLGRYKRQGRLQTARGKAAPLYLTEFGYARGGASFGGQGGGRTDAERLRNLGRSYAKAKAAGARQFLTYQLMPTVRPTTTIQGGALADTYGRFMGWGPSRTVQDNSVWDTSIADAGGNIPVINRGMKLSQSRPRARAAKVRRKRG